MNKNLNAKNNKNKSIGNNNKTSNVTSISNVKNTNVNNASNKNNNVKKEILDPVGMSKKSLISISKKIDKIDASNFNDNEVRNILSLIDKELELSSNRMVEHDNNKKDNLLKEEASLYEEFLKLNKKLFDKVSKSKPFESFFYSQDGEKEEMIKKFFNKMNLDIHWLDLESINFNSDYKEALNEKNSIISDSLIDVLESNLNVAFSDAQKKSLKKDFSKIALSLQNENIDEIIEECNKIKTVSNIKLITRPSYKNFISKSELKRNDASKKLSTLRVDFLNYITLNKADKIKTINENLEVQLKSIREILEQEREEYSKKMKVLFLLLLLSCAATPIAPAFGATSVIAIGSAACYMQSKVIISNNKIKKIKDEIKAIKNNESQIAKSSFEKLEETSKELLSNEEYSEIAKLYIKKKKESLKAQELKEKIESQMRLTILESLDEMSESKKDNIVEKIKDKYTVKTNEVKKENEITNDKNLNFDVELEL